MQPIALRGAPTVSHTQLADDCALQAGVDEGSAATGIVCKNSQSVHQYFLNTYYVPGVLVDPLEGWFSSFSQHQNHLESSLNMQTSAPSPMSVEGLVTWFLMSSQVTDGHLLGNTIQKV